MNHHIYITRVGVDKFYCGSSCWLGSWELKLEFWELFNNSVCFGLN
jgi:hypothetical protein